jgi:hypothetical protein
LREECIDDSVQAQGKTRRYAEGIRMMLVDLAEERGETNLFNDGFEFWGEIPLSGEIAERLLPYAKAINVEKRVGQRRAEERGHKNKSTWWAQVRAIGERPKGKGEREVKAISEVFKPTLEALYKRAWRDQAEFATIEDRQAFKALADTLANVYKVRLATLQHKAEVKTPAKATPKGKASK